MGDNRMRVGLLWFDDDPKKEVSLKVKEAAERYFQKFGRWPNVCYVAPATFPLEGVHHDGLRVLSSPQVLPDHFWIGESHQSKETNEKALQGQG